MLEQNIKGTAAVTVTDENTAKTMGSGSLEVFATPALAALMEKAACNCLDARLEDGMTSVGTKLDIQHTAATPKGMRITCEAVLTEIDGRRLVFEVSAADKSGEIGRGRHERFIVNAEKFTAKAYSKG